MSKLKKFLGLCVFLVFLVFLVLVSTDNFEISIISTELYNFYFLVKNCLFLVYEVFDKNCRQSSSCVYLKSFIYQNKIVLIIIFFLIFFIILCQMEVKRLSRTRSSKKAYRKQRQESFKRKN